MSDARTNGRVNHIFTVRVMINSINEGWIRYIHSKCRLHNLLLA